MLKINLKVYFTYFDGGFPYKRIDKLTEQLVEIVKNNFGEREWKNFKCVFNDKIFSCTGLGLDENEEFDTTQTAQDFVDIIDVEVKRMLVLEDLDVCVNSFEVFVKCERW